jgi:hypothetical protein
VVGTDPRSVGQCSLVCGVVTRETNFAAPSREDLEQMARRRFQNQKPKIEGNWWYIRTWQDQFLDGKRVRKQKRIKLAPSSIPERKVKKIAAENLRPLNQGLVTIGSATKFNDFVECEYVPTVLPLMANSTQDRYRGVIANYLKPTFGDLCLRDLTPLTGQR